MLHLQGKTVTFPPSLLTPPSLNLSSLLHSFSSSPYHFSLLIPSPSPLPPPPSFPPLTHSLSRDQTVVAQAIKKYMNQYSVPQREVVEKTGLNQSHLSQHFLHGVTMKRSKRVKLYHWFEDDQKVRTGSEL